MQGVSLRSRAVAFAASAGAVVVILTLLLGSMIYGDVMDLGGVLIVSILCGTLSWASTKHSMSGIANAVDQATERLLRAAHGDLQADVPAEVGACLPDLGVAMESLFSQVRANLENVQILAMFDPVTGLANRVNFCRQVDRLLLERDMASFAALFFIDLDKFKAVNDTLGHAAGDQLLARVAGRLREVVMAQVSAGTGDAVIGRLAGDEFTMFFPDLPHHDAATRIARAVQFALAERFDLGGQQIELAASIGVAFYPDHGESLAALLRSADIAMYHAKKEGRGRVQLFTIDLAREAAGKAELERELRIALERGEFLLQFQPQVDVGHGHAVAAEALIRWAHPDRDMIMPGTFVPLAEQNGVIVELGDWVMDQVCETAARWYRAGLSQRIAINISTRELSQADFFMRLRHSMARHQTPPQTIELEITESLAMEMDEGLLGQLRALRDDGVLIAIDDFGTGYSNLSRLKDLPVDRVKIDRSLVRDIAISAEARTICSAVIGLIQGLGLDVVIEGVESQDQVDLLRVIGCTVFQGYHLARPTDEAEYLRRFGLVPHALGAQPGMAVSG
ncbi:bifunctional diguanylate cyclase/phosphodiesterase [Sphingobium aquiterrae]|uniref:putative bifunctional diguanylate cyclase/phosphodiesterase n=1 Tax=Sphingobium aquiterrae TaxID=2038656 RepID=UPI0030190F42